MTRKHISSRSTAFKTKTLSLITIYSFCGRKNSICLIRRGAGVFQGQKYTKGEDLVRGHPREAKKVPVTGADRLRECKSTVACITGAS